MPQIECPQCHAVYELDTVRRTADDFCPTPTCDYPLFWAVPERVAVVGGNGDGDSRRRLPGTGGKLTIGFRECPECGDHSPMGAKHCVSCGANLDTPPAPKTVVVTAPPPAPAEPAPPPAQPVPWVVLALVVLASVIAVLLSVR